MGQRFFALTASALLFAAAGAGAASAPKQIRFQCDVAEGPRLTGCVAKDAGRLDPRKVEHLRRQMEASPACLLADLKPGMSIEQTTSYVDAPDLLVLPAPPTHIIVQPDWLRRPSEQEVEAAYPRAAKRVFQAGFALVKCKVSHDGAPFDCAVLREGPPHFGFGAAGIEVALKARFKPQTRDCLPTDGGTVLVPIGFNPPSR